MTGRYPVRPGIYPGVFAANSIGGLQHNETTIAESLKKVGYATGIVGKWHLGVGKDGEYLPTTQGFDSYVGIPYSNDMCPCKTCFYPDEACIDHGEQSASPCPLYHNTTIVEQPADYTHLSENYSIAATSFIKRNVDAGQPFFLYMAFQHVHVPNFAGKQFTNSSIRGKFGDSLSELDWLAGQILDTVRESAVSRDTFVFFTADNGPWLLHEIYGGSPGPLRCGKASTWEGGMREAAISWWPGKITPGRSMEVASTLDLYPTILSITGATGPENVTMDGVDMSPILFNGKQSQRDHFFYYPPNPTHDADIYAVRWKQYKAHYFTKGGSCPSTYPDEVCRGNYSLREHDPPLLYNLEQDPGEVYELPTKDYADVLEKIDTLRSEFKKTVVWGEPQIGRGKDPRLFPCAKPGCSPFPSCCTTE